MRCHRCRSALFATGKLDTGAAVGPAVAQMLSASRGEVFDIYLGRDLGGDLLIADSFERAILRFRP